MCAAAVVAAAMGCDDAHRLVHGTQPASGPVVEQDCGRLAQWNARCLSVRVFENREAPGRSIPLRVVVLRATRPDPAPDPVVLLAGGPGQAATDFLADPSLLSGPLRERRDLVFADQRGTGGSNSLACRFYGPPTSPHTYFTQFLPLDKVRECRAALDGRADLTQYTTSSSVEDLEAIRVALGYPQINLIGGSYGTRLAIEYLRHYGPRVRTAVLESPVTPGSHAPERFGELAARALDGVLDECAATPACAKAFPDIRREAAEVFARLRTGPVRVAVQHPVAKVTAEVTLTREHVAESLRYLTYSTRGASLIPLFLHRAFAGDFTLFADALIRWRAAGTFDGLYLSITCAEDVPFIARDAAERDDPTYLGGYRVREQQAACAVWPKGTRGSRQFDPVESDVPVLIVSGTLDPVTPPSNGDELARTLRRSLHLRVPSAGHSPSGLSGLECLDKIRQAFIDRGTVDQLDTACVAGMSRPGFAIE